MKKKAIITVTEGEDGVAVRIHCLPSVGEAGVCAALGAVGFQAIAKSCRELGSEELENQEGD
ncbi:MAG TPA: hypothetical protein H9768_06665 [Candidatus Mailhella merdavium]|nr:hypothetical protein [Candidatus Mailhella merdavium]